jgi:hypothetical protein
MGGKLVLTLKEWSGRDTWYIKRKISMSRFRICCDLELLSMPCGWPSGSKVFWCTWLWQKKHPKRVSMRPPFYCRNRWGYMLWVRNSLLYFIWPTFGRVMAKIRNTVQSCKNRIRHSHEGFRWSFFCMDLVGHTERIPNLQKNISDRVWLLRYCRNSR